VAERSGWHIFCSLVVQRRLAMNENEFERPQDEATLRLLAEFAKYTEGVDEEMEQLDKEIETTERDVADARRLHFEM
jgi:hypothetical protein